ncbi:TfoX/Sxy family protein [Methylovirgula sp. 4M-Z18]|uniref:TfoX/Sxy family protein n=1 Tax=Methylovirgula sp. 4M-Z18 TaxID=2293567 RepID=UPI000E2E61AF|nr:TfoX/Sxy family protein [Methylovirgula sp. 4M-Z18]RFB75667.1 cold-shock protein [Methylovirgula sp. 4M-Z18]
MARDAGLEELVRDHLAPELLLSERTMFGGYAWLLDGNLLCGARDDGVLIRLGKGNDQWALAIDRIVPMISRGRAMSGWVRVAPETFADEALARRLISAALAFVRTLPPK